jgi:hypothetical protein
MTVAEKRNKGQIAARNCGARMAACQPGSLRGPSRDGVVRHDSAMRAWRKWKWELFQARAAFQIRQRHFHRRGFGTATALATFADSVAETVLAAELASASAKHKREGKPDSPERP